MRCRRSVRCISGMAECFTRTCSSACGSGKTNISCSVTCLCNLPQPFCPWVENNDHDDGSSSSAISIVSLGYITVLSQEITCRRGMAHWRMGSAFSGLINVICICRIKLILIRGRFSTWGPFLSFSRNLSLIKWSLDNAHLARENKAHYHTVCRGREFYRDALVWKCECDAEHKDTGTGGLKSNAVERAADSPVNAMWVWKSTKQRVPGE